MSQGRYFSGGIVKDNFANMTSGEKMVYSILNGLREELERVPKTVKSIKNDVTFETRTAKDGTFVAEFRVCGRGMPLRAKDGKEENRHTIVKLVFDLRESSCTATICPAIIPGMDMSREPLKDSPATEAKAGVLHDLVRNKLANSTLARYSINYGMLRNESYRSPDCPFRVNKQEQAKCATVR
jgi:hypothetical protein